MWDILCGLERYFWFLVLSRGHTKTHKDRKVTFGPNATRVYTTIHSGQNNLEPCRIWISFESNQAFIWSLLMTWCIFSFWVEAESSPPLETLLRVFPSWMFSWLCCRDEKNRNFYLVYLADPLVSVFGTNSPSIML